MPRFIRSFGFALRGIAAAVREERNLRFHLCAAVYVVLFSFFYALTRLEYAILALVIAAVIALELVNSAIERIVDHLCAAPSPLAGTVKDLAAGAVLVAAIASVVCGALLFWDVAVFRNIVAWFAARPVCIVLLAASLAVCWWWVFRWGRPKKENGDKLG